MEKKKIRESELEKKRESAGDFFFTKEGRSARDLNEGEKEKEGGGDRDTTCVEQIA